MIIQTWVVLSDLQIPWHDKEVVYGLVVPFIHDLKPQGIVLDGDIVDCYAISDFDKNPDHPDWTLALEQKEVGVLLGALGKVRTIEKKEWIDGNHEDRWRRIAWRNHKLKGMLKSFPEAFSLKEYGYQWHPYGDHVMLGKLMVTHGELVRKHSADSGQAHFDRFGTSVLVGHTHRLGVYYKSDCRGVHAAYENGCLCSLKPEYTHFPNWQQGFSVVKVYGGGLFSVQQIPVINRRFLLYGDKEFRR